MTFAAVPASPFLDDDLEEGIFDPADANTWRTRWTDALDGRGTGSSTYSPSSPIVIDSSGLDAGYTHGLVMHGDGAVTRKFQPNMKLTTRTITRHFVVDVEERGDYSQVGGNVWQQGGSGGSTIRILLEKLPHGGQIQKIHLRWTGAAITRAALPTLPSFDLYRIDENGTATSVANETDASGSVGAYEANHDITWDGTASPIDIDTATYRYILKVTGENTPNFATGARIQSLRMEIAVSQYVEY